MFLVIGDLYQCFTFVCIQFPKYDLNCVSYNDAILQCCCLSSQKNICPANNLLQLLPFVLLYADEILLISSSVSELQSLVTACEKVLLALDMSLNAGKSNVCKCLHA